MRWLVIGLLVSVGALLLVAVAVTRHVARQKRLLAADASDLDRQKAQHLELDLALHLGEAPELNADPLERPSK
jgi:hypothetical protein